MLNYKLSPLFNQWIGFDKLANNIQDDLEDIGYPPYNIEKKDDKNYSITLALAGFKQEGLSIELEGPRLTIKGKPVLDIKETHYLHQGLVCKEFSLSFTLAEHMTVKQANFNYGLLKIELELHIPESMQPRHIAISGNNNYYSGLQDRILNKK
ncbi:Small heat shock protein IbpB [secondary endosymbiont of Trabutina mannipara]|uniref:Small heat shock protein IbpB n=1 Tax=secondary endosymbiont of Trabutina mannipara TaxID=1835721 RepID=A0A1C3L432_9ENTR|nr:Hsp20 family protein [secondary endosymbiont of Trabutina mannipara]SBT82038.1 Small heat shock protein IbpB [secondary endosymbiont of Trabutina mannipara]